MCTLRMRGLIVMMLKFLTAKRLVWLLLVNTKYKLPTTVAVNRKIRMN